MRSGLMPMESGDFSKLVATCGLDLDESDLHQLARRNIIAPWQPADGEAGYTALHLYVAARYLRAVESTDHPWSTGSSDVDLDETADLAAELNELLDAASGDGAVGAPDVLEKFLVGVERFLARIDPFGPLAEIVDLLRPDVISKLRNSGRLFVEVRRGVYWLSRQFDGDEDGQTAGPPPLKSPMVEAPSERELRSTQIIDDEPTSEAARQAIDAVVEATESSDPEENADSGGRAMGDVSSEEVTIEVSISTETTEKITEPFPAPADSEALAEESSEPIVVGGDEDGLIEESSEPIVVGGDDEGLSEETSEPIVLESPDGDGDAGGGGQRQTLREDRRVAVKSLPEKIAELNRRRQAYMKEGAWAELAALYEDGLDLFTDADERRQVFTSLGALYEKRLQSPKSALQAYLRAWKEKKDTQRGDKIMESVLRVAAALEYPQSFRDWLTELLGEPAQVDEVIEKLSRPDEGRTANQVLAELLAD